jgi:hypothetical protein
MCRLDQKQPRLFSAAALYHHPMKLSEREDVTSQDFIKFWGKIFVFVLLVLIELSQGFKTF